MSSDKIIRIRPSSAKDGTSSKMLFNRSQSDMVSYEDLIVAQYLEQLRANRNKAAQKRPPPASPYLSKIVPQSSRRLRPRSANIHGRPPIYGKPKIDAKFIADPNLWDAASPAPSADSGSRVKSARKRRPFSAPTRRSRPLSGSSAHSGKHRLPWRPSSSRHNSLYQHQPQPIVVAAYRNGSHDVMAQVTAPNMKMLLESCTDKLSLPFAARRIFLEGGQEVLAADDIDKGATIYVSMGDNFKDPYAGVKQNTINKDGAMWTKTGVMLPEDGKPKQTRTKMSKRMKSLLEKKKVRILVFLNGKSTEPAEILADLDNILEFFAACTTRFDMFFHAKILYTLTGQSIHSLHDVPPLDESFQQGPTLVLGPLWVSSGESFNPSSAKCYAQVTLEVVNKKLQEAKKYKEELEYFQDDEGDNGTSINQVETDIAKLAMGVSELRKALKKLEELIFEQKDKGPEYTMKHIRKFDSDHRLVGLKGLRLKVYENGQSENETVFYFNLRGGVRGIGSDREKLRLRLLDDLSQSCRTTDTQHPRLAPIAKKIYDKFGNEINDVMSLEYDQEIWLSFGEAFICPFTYCFQLVCDKVRAYDVIGQGQCILRETLTVADYQKQDDASKWDATIGFPMIYDGMQVIDPDHQPEEAKHLASLREMSEIDARSHFLQSTVNPDLVIYPELVVSEKMRKGTKALWPQDSQLWMISKSGYIFSRGVPQLCVGVSDIRVTAPTTQGRNVEGFAINLQKRMVENPYQKWSFNSDGTLSCQEHPDLVLTYLGNKNGDEESEITDNVEGAKPGNKVFMVVSERLRKRDAVIQRFALKQERFDNMGQWKHTETDNPEFSKQAYSWPTTRNGSLNEKFDWPIEAFLIPNAPPLHVKSDKNGLSIMPKRLMAVRNGERDQESALPVVGPDLTNLLKEADKHCTKKEDKQPHDDDIDDIYVTPDSVDADIHCQEISVRQLEFVMFLDHSTAILDLPFAGRRLFDENGVEHFSLRDLSHDQLVYISCGEAWSDPLLSRTEQQRRFLLSQLSHDVTQIRQYVALRKPLNYVLEIDGGISANSVVSVNKQWSPPIHDNAGETTVDTDHQKREEKYQDVESELEWAMSAHEKSHQKSEERNERLKWPWERLVNATAQFDWTDPQAYNYTDKEMYEKYKPKPTPKAPRDHLQRFDFQDGFLMSSANNDLVLGVQEYQGHKNRVMLVKKQLDNVNQRWIMSENGDICLKYSRQSALTVTYPTMQQSESDNPRPLNFIGCVVTVQNKKTSTFGRANQCWRYDPETGFLKAFSSNDLDLEITAANKADVCTYTVAGFSPLNQPGYLATVATVNKFGDGKMRDIRVCTSCARAMRGRCKLTKVKDTESFACAMGQAKKLKLKQIGSFRLLNGKVDLSTHEAQLTLENCETQYRKLKEETSVRAIATEMSTTNVVHPVKLLVYKNGEGRLRAGECIVASSIEGLLTQCTERLKLPFAATKIYTEDGTVIIAIDDLKTWAVDNYRCIMRSRVDRMMKHGNTGVNIDYDEEDEIERNEQTDHTTEMNIDSLANETLSNINTIVKQSGDVKGQSKVADDTQKESKTIENSDDSRRGEHVMRQLSLPSVETILRYPVEIWVSSGKAFIAPDAVESRSVNKKKQRIFRSAISLELDIEKHIARKLKGRRLEDLYPGDYKSTLSSSNPVVVVGSWQEPSNSEQLKHSNIKKLEHHYGEVKQNQRDTASLKTANYDLTHRLYQQPVTKRIIVYPNGESIDRAQYIWVQTMEEILTQATQKLSLWKKAKCLFTESGQPITDFDEVQRDQFVCVSHGNAFKNIQAQVQQEIEVKANWSRARKKYGPSATDYAVSSTKHPQVDVDPFGPPKLALPVGDMIS